MSDLSKRLKRFKDYSLVDFNKARKLGERVFVVNKQTDFVLPIYKSLKTPKIDILYIHLAKTFSKSQVYKIIKSYEDRIKFAQYGYNHIDVYYALEDAERVAYCNSIYKYLPVLYKEINKYFKGLLEKLNPIEPLPEFASVSKGKESAETFLRIYIKQYIFMENISQTIKNKDFETLNLFNKEFANSHKIISLPSIVSAGRFCAIKDIESFVQVLEKETNVLKFIINYGELISLYKSFVLKALMNRIDLLFMKFGAQTKNDLLISLFIYQYERLSLQMNKQSIKDVEKFYPKLSQKLASLVTVNEENNIVFYEKLETIFNGLLNEGIEIALFDKFKLFNNSNKTEIEFLIKDKIEEILILVNESKYETKTNFFEKKIKIDINDATNEIYQLIKRLKVLNTESLQEVMYKVIVNKHIQYKYGAFNILEKEFGIDRIYYMAKFTNEMYKVALTVGFAKIKKFAEFEFNNDKLNKLINESKRFKEKESSEDAEVLANRKKLLEEASNVIKKEIFDKARFNPLEKIICNDESFFDSEIEFQSFNISEIDYEENYIEIEESEVINSEIPNFDLNNEEINIENTKPLIADLNKSEESNDELAKDSFDMSEKLTIDENIISNQSVQNMNMNRNETDKNYYDTNKFITLKINKKYCVVKKEKTLNKKCKESEESFKA